MIHSEKSFSGRNLGLEKRALSYRYFVLLMVRRVAIGSSDVRTREDDNISEATALILDSMKLKLAIDEVNDLVQQTESVAIHSSISKPRNCQLGDLTNTRKRLSHRWMTVSSST